MKDSKGALILQGIFWIIIVVAALVIMITTDSKLTIKREIISFGLFGILNVSIFYINYLFLIPGLVKKKKQYWVYAISFFLIIVIVAIIKTGVAVLYPGDMMIIRGKSEEYNVNEYFFGKAFLAGFFMVSSCIIKFTVDWFSSERIQRNLESERREMELQFLKSQLNPHFLFNSLNNIYSLAYQKSDKTADAIMKLSEIMRYMIYESNTPTVALSKEVDYLSNYIELQKIRFKDGAFIELTLNGEIDDQKIVPLMLISFVENAFKHGVVNDPENPVKINIIA
ncbi:MAG: histidine kinase, partial [Pedobacter sp.]